MLEPPFITELSNAKSVLIAGAGGGFDVFCGLPLFFALKEKGITVNLASLSFSFNQGEVTGEKIGSEIVKVTAKSTGNEYYFPEGYLAQWFCRKRMEQSIYCIRPAGPPSDCSKSFWVIIADDYWFALDRNLLLS